MSEASASPRSIPRENTLESGPGLLRDGYEFIAKRSQRLGSDVFRTRLMFQETVCLTGEEGARLFYDGGKFRRAGAAPVRVRKTLFGTGAIQATDDALHRSRKALFMSLMTPESIARLSGLFAAHWRAMLPRWTSQGRVVLFPAVRELLLRAICGWAAVPLAESEIGRRSRDIAAVIDGAGGFGLRHWRGRIARKRCEAWMRAVIGQARDGGIVVPPGSALHAVSTHLDPGDALLGRQTAAVELFNLIRPAVAVDRFITFAALALHRHPACRAALTTGGTDDLERFAQEVRRFYPFFPFVVARVREDFEWRGYRFRKGVRTLLDLYGTDHDARSWGDPEVFRPDRFRTWNGSAFNFIPQGGGDHLTGHRCPGEWITIELMKVAVRFLTVGMSYDVPEQDLTVSLRRMPTLPKSGFVIDRVRDLGAW